MKPLALTSPCPCGRTHGLGKSYGQCCGRWLESDAPAPDAELLMRSRYSAFVLEREAYLLHTWHASTRPISVAFDPAVKWLGLEIRRVVAPAVSAPDQAQVEFVARHKPLAAPAVRLHELSHFVREAGFWTYLDGVLQ